MGQTEPNCCINFWWLKYQRYINARLAKFNCEEDYQVAVVWRGAAVEDSYRNTLKKRRKDAYDIVDLDMSISSVCFHWYWFPSLQAIPLLQQPLMFLHYQHALQEWPMHEGIFALIYFFSLKAPFYHNPPKEGTLPVWNHFRSKPPVSAPLHKIGGIFYLGKNLNVLGKDCIHLLVILLIYCWDLFESDWDLYYKWVKRFKLRQVQGFLIVDRKDNDHI